MSTEFSIDPLRAVGSDAGFADLWRVCNGCLKSAITAHGPITKDNYGSAGKRIAGQLQALVAQWIEHGDSTSVVAGSIPAEGTIHSANANVVAPPTLDSDLPRDVPGG